MDIIDYINKMNVYEFVDNFNYITQIEKIVTKFINENGYMPSSISLSEKLYYELEREVCYLPTWNKKWSYEYAYIKYNEISICQSKKCSENKIILNI